MPTPGLSLHGFLNEAHAVGFLRNQCVVGETSDQQLISEWNEARSRLGDPIPRAGHPEILPIPADGQQHLTQLTSQPWVQHALITSAAGATFQMVELAPLLAYQLHVDLARSDHHNGGNGHVPTTEEIFLMCLPLEPKIENVRINPYPNTAQPSSLLITSQGLNFQPQLQGWIPTPSGIFVGLQVGVRLPLLHVVRFNGRCYLHNGFHRAVGLLRRGVTHAPCLLRDVPTEQHLGLAPPQTFDLALLESENPPTLTHFTENRPCQVMLKRVTRTLHVSWADHIITDD